MTLKRAIEAMLFASARPLQPAEVRSALKAATRTGEDGAEEIGAVTEKEIAGAIRELREEYERDGRGLRMRETSGGWRMTSDPECAPWVSQLFPEARPARLSPAALETLAIIAYRQPITRADVEAVRGVAIDSVLQTLLERDYIQVAGRSELVGRPLLYETTSLFLERFGLRDLEDLPNAAELRAVPLPRAEEPEEPDPAPPGTPQLPGIPADLPYVPPVPDVPPEPEEDTEEAPDDDDFDEEEEEDEEDSDDEEEVEDQEDE